MPKKRQPENKGFPAGWRWKNGAIYYQVPKSVRKLWDGKQLFRLGKTPPEAYATYAARIGTIDKAATISKLLDRYAIEVIPCKAPKTQSENIRQLDKLRRVFGPLPLLAIQPSDIYKYVDKRKAKVSAHREIALLKHAFTKAVQWGFISRHPFKGEVRLAGEKPRTRYIEDWEIIECMGLSCARKKGSVKAIQAYIRLKLLTGLRRGDLLRLRVGDLGEKQIRVETHKSGKSIIYEVTDQLFQAIESAKLVRPIDISPYLFCDKFGQCYIDEKTGDASGWDSMWQRFMQRILAETKVKERFTEHDLRAKVGSDAESLERARQLLAHADSKITNRVYRRKPEVIRPAK